MYVQAVGTKGFLDLHASYKSFKFFQNMIQVMKKFV